MRVRVARGVSAIGDAEEKREKKGRRRSDRRVKRSILYISCSFCYLMIDVEVWNALPRMRIWPPSPNREYL
jgi:hypothetical protein